MYKTIELEYLLLSFFQFVVSCGIQLDSQNIWAKAANQLPWKVREEEKKVPK